MIDRSVIVNKIIEDTLISHSIPFKADTMLKKFMSHMLGEDVDKNMKDFFFKVIVSSDKLQPRVNENLEEA